MCVSSSPARLENTAILTSVNDQNEVLSIYENDAANGNDSQEYRGANSMIFAVPSNINNIELVSLKTCPNFLTDLAGFIRNYGSRGLGMGMKGAVKIIDYDDLYTVVIAENASDIPNIINDSPQIPSNRQIQPNQTLFDFFDAYYKKVFLDFYGYTEWSFIIALFNTTSLKRGRVGITYPLPQSNQLFIPGLDCHTGGIPDITNPIDRDHTLIFMLSEISGHSVPVNLNNSTFREPIPNDLKKLFPVPGKAIIVDKVGSNHRNGDWMIHINDLKDGVLIKRKLYSVNNL